MRQKSKAAMGIQVLLFAFFAAAVFVPLFGMLSNLGSVNFGALFSSPQFAKGLGNSLLLAVSAAILSLVVAQLLAFSVERSALKHKNLVTFLLTIPMLIPSISHGMGLVILFGQNGLLTKLLGLGGSVYGFGGVLAGSVLYAFPIAFLMLRDVLKYEDCSAYDAADILGIPKLHQFVKITLPYLRKPLINTGFAVFALVITDYGVPLMVGGKFSTLPVILYEEVVGLLNFGKGSAIGLVLLVPALLAFLVDLFAKDKGVHSFVVAKKHLGKSALRDFAARGFCAVVSLVVATPIIAFCLLSFMKKYPVDLSFSFAHIQRSFSLGAGKYLLNSVIIALLVSGIGTLVCYVTAYFSARVPGLTSRALHLCAVLSMAIPGLVLGISYALTYKGSFLYGTIAILVMVNLGHFFSSPYLIAYNSFGKVNRNLEAVGLTLGIGRFYMLKDILLPQMAGTIFEMLSYFFVNSMMTISAVSFLFAMGSMPLSLLITQFEAQMLIECSAFVSIVILGVNVFVKCVLLRFKDKKTKESDDGTE